jgi:hypothetical protein
MFTQLGRDPSTLHVTDNRRQQQPWEHDAALAGLRTGDLVIIGRNDNGLGLYNGTRAVITAIDVAADSLTLRTDDDRHVTITATWAARHGLSHACAMTLHKAQGLTVDHACSTAAMTVSRSRPRRTRTCSLEPIAPATASITVATSPRGGDCHRRAYYASAIPSLGRHRTPCHSRWSADFEHRGTRRD